MRPFLYNHGGSGNHGCEALIRTVSHLIDEEDLLILSEEPQQDYRYDIQNIAEIKNAKSEVSKLSIDFIKAYLQLKFKGDYFPLDILPYTKPVKELNKNDVEISVGGDIYCYEDYPKFIQLHQLIHQRGCKSVLLGCSLEKKLFDNPAFLQDMRDYTYISARETLTYQLLKDAGLNNVGYCPDTAFVLPTEKLELPSGFIENNTIGINVSPLVVRKEKSQGIVYHNFVELIKWILTETDCNVALIPHVVWDDNDDRTILKKLHDEFIDTERVVLIDDCNCMQMKGYIARCRMFVGARTHATIAAYSSLVPTLVLGYSIKSKGIAKDLFGTDENYVIPIEKLSEINDLKNAFQWVWNNEAKIREHLINAMPGYVAKVHNLKCMIEEALEEKF